MKENTKDVSLKDVDAELASSVTSVMASLTLLLAWPFCALSCKLALLSILWGVIQLKKKLA